ncbi:hypothetical protein PVK06_027234 [Gossypium arboreum]|uniref:Uncharacterized protein n=1 Tax=Gossypium arboreum TaxID=29729 RepID=A0ABR0P108_GOSAR|nr:hypothetical protein PVK06_027234 [Gossypium arboreum]
MEAQNTHFPPSMRQMYNHTRGRNVTARSIGGWVSHHGISGGSKESGPLDSNVGEGPKQGSVVLSILYRELCRAMQLDKMSIGGFLLLLQSWT